jgi:hypothetical protein
MNGPEMESDGRIPLGPSALSRGVARCGLGGLRTLVAVSGIIAGLAAFGIGEATREWVPPEKVRTNFFGAVRERVTRDSPRVAIRTAALAFGVMGLCLGGCLGITGGLARRSLPASVAGGLLGAVLGALLGAGVTLGLLPFFMQMRSQFRNNDLVIGMLVHGVIWGPLGAAAGLAVAIGLGEPRLIGRAVAAGFAGAVVGSVAFDVIGAFAFPLAKTDSPISQTWTSRLLARLLVSVGTAAVVALLLPGPRPTQTASPKPSIPTTIPEV